MLKRAAAAPVAAAAAAVAAALSRATMVIDTGGGGRATRPAPGTREDLLAHYELREKLAEHLWYLKTHKLLKWDAGSSPLSNLGYNIDKEIAGLIDEMLA